VASLSADDFALVNKASLNCHALNPVKLKVKLGLKLTWAAKWDLRDFWSPKFRSQRRQQSLEWWLSLLTTLCH